MRRAGNREILLNAISSPSMDPSTNDAPDSHSVIKSALFNSGSARMNSSSMALVFRRYGVGFSFGFFYGFNHVVISSYMFFTEFLDGAVFEHTFQAFVHFG